VPAIAWPVVGAGAVLLKTATAARRAIGENLERAGYAVRAAGSAAEARRLVETEEPALAIVDLILPDGGISVPGELRGACSHRKCSMAAVKKEALDHWRRIRATRSNQRRSSAIGLTRVDQYSRTSAGTSRR
jgi:CheY-like chemotaxis protein